MRRFPRLFLMELVFLGTGSAYPSPHRGASCTALRTDAEGVWLFDCGEGSQIQLMRSAVKPGKISKIFITHLHGDHLFGLPGLLCTINQSSNMDTNSKTNNTDDIPPIEIYGPHGLCHYLRTCLSLSRSFLAFQYRVNELMTNITPRDIDGVNWTPCHTADSILHPNELEPRQIPPTPDGTWELCTSGSIKVYAGRLKHRVITFGYVIEEDNIPGKLLVHRLQELGVPAGPLYGKLKKGEAITAPNGLTIKPTDVMGPPQKGRKLVIMGDTCDSQNIAQLARNPDVLVHEATNENSHEEKCVQNGHSTPRMAAEFALSIGAKRLLLTHFSQRYKVSDDTVQENDEESTVDKLVLEAQSVFGPEVYAAEDFKKFPIPLNK